MDKTLRFQNGIVGKYFSVKNVLFLQLKLSDLELDYHARLQVHSVWRGSHYDKKTDILTLESDRSS